MQSTLWLFCLYASRMEWLSILVLLILSIAYITIGGIIFYFLEGNGRSDHVTQNLTQIAETFLQMYPDVGTGDLEQLLRQVIVAHDTGSLEIHNYSQTKHHLWDFSQSIFYAGTVVSTIGYGSLQPRTESGRHFTMFYAVLGIPIFMVFLAGLGDKINSATQNCLDKMRIGKVYPRISRLVKICVFLVLGNVLFAFLPALLFCELEDWTFYDSVYYAFISLSTIGFGDFLAGFNPLLEYPGWYMAVHMCWLVLGMSWLSLCIGAKQEALKNFLQLRQDRQRQVKQRGESVAAVNQQDNARRELYSPKKSPKNFKNMSSVYDIEENWGLLNKKGNQEDGPMCSHDLDCHLAKKPLTNKPSNNSDIL